MSGVHSKTREDAGRTPGNNPSAQPAVHRFRGILCFLNERVLKPTNRTHELVTEQNADKSSQAKSQKEFPPVPSTESEQRIEGEDFSV